MSDSPSREGHGDRVGDRDDGFGSRRAKRDGDGGVFPFRDADPRVEAGIASDGVGPGVRGGLTWIPLRSWATPIVGVSAGQMFERDANPLVRMISGDPTFSSPLLQRVGYHFASARIGLELGRSRVTFFIHAGVSAVTAQIHGLDMATNTAGSSSSPSVTVSTSDPHIRIVGVSANLGFIVYLF